MKKSLDIEYMNNALKLKTGVRAGGLGAGNANGSGKGPEPVAIMMYGIFVPVPHND